MLMMMRRPEFLMMRRPEFLMMRRPCAALRCPALPCAALQKGVERYLYYYSNVKYHRLQTTLPEERRVPS
jgi:hypothetical protein